MAPSGPGGEGDEEGADKGGHGGRQGLLARPRRVVHAEDRLGVEGPRARGRLGHGMGEEEREAADGVGAARGAEGQHALHEHADEGGRGVARRVVAEHAVLRVQQPIPFDAPDDEPVTTITLPSRRPMPLPLCVTREVRGDPMSRIAFQRDGHGFLDGLRIAEFTNGGVHHCCSV